MVKIIYVMIAVFILSFVFVPVMSNVSKEHDALLQSYEMNDSALTDQPIASETASFDEIYAFIEQEQANDPAALNDIAPAAGEEAQDEGFSSGFSKTGHSAL